ncbi:hypothetical protein P7C70_g3255, partial [Phenoliferia sp. Uapishka_3]
MSIPVTSNETKPLPFLTGSHVHPSVLAVPQPESQTRSQSPSTAGGLGSSGDSTNFNNAQSFPPPPSSLSSYDLPVSSYPTASTSALPPMIQFDPRGSPTYGELDDNSDEEDGDVGVASRPKKRKSVANLRGAAQKESGAKAAAAEGDDPDDKGRRKIMIEYIEEKSKRHITFSKRKAGIMKKAYELATLTGTQVLLLVVSESGWVYTFTTDKFKPLVKEDDNGQLSQGQKLIAACLEAKDPSATTYPPTSTAAAFEANSAHHGGQIALKTNTRPPLGGRPLSTNRRVSTKGRHPIPMAINTGHPPMPMPLPSPTHSHHQLATPMSGNPIPLSGGGYLDPNMGGMGSPQGPRGRTRSAGQGPPVSPGHMNTRPMQHMQQQQMDGYDQMIQRTDMMHMHHGGGGGGYEGQQYLENGMGYQPNSQQHMIRALQQPQEDYSIPPQHHQQSHHQQHHSGDYSHLPRHDSLQSRQQPQYADYSQQQDPYRQQPMGASYLPQGQGLESDQR